MRVKTTSEKIQISNDTCGFGTTPCLFEGHISPIHTVQDSTSEAARKSPDNMHCPGFFLPLCWVR